MKSNLTLLLMFFCLQLFSQDKKPIRIQLVQNGDSSYYKLYVQDAPTAAYWGEKGIAAQEFMEKIAIENLELQTKILEQDRLLANMRGQRDEYQTMVMAANAQKREAEKNEATWKATSNEWEEKAKKRGETLWAIGIGAVLVIGGAILAK